jgi:hypothetical protein
MCHALAALGASPDCRVPRGADQLQGLCQKRFANEKRFSQRFCGS